MPKHPGGKPESKCWDHANRAQFIEYYRQASLSESAVQRSTAIRASVLAVVAATNRRISEVLDVADIGCGPGTQSSVWLEQGHCVHGLDVSEAFIETARDRLGSLPGANFQVGSATSLPWEDASMDVCLLPELLEHVPEWELCLLECARVLRKRGVLFVSTTNTLCPIQNEFTLPGFSWYPAIFKRRLAILAKTRWPSIAGHATYPAVNWFSYPGLMRIIDELGFDVHDRFQVAAMRGVPGMKGKVLETIAARRLLRRCAYFVSVASLVVGVKR